MTGKPTFDMDKVVWGFELDDPDVVLADEPDGVHAPDPDPAKTRTGWLYKDRPPYRVINWFMHRVTRILQWQRRGITTVFRSIPAALGDDELVFAGPDRQENPRIDDDDVFFVKAYPAWAPGQEFSRITVADPVQDMCADGRNVYVVTDAKVNAYATEAPHANRWAYDLPVGATVPSIVCTGEYVVVCHRQSGGDDRLTVLSAWDGSVIEDHIIVGSQGRRVTCCDGVLIVTLLGDAECWLIGDLAGGPHQSLSWSADAHAATITAHRLIILGEKDGDDWGQSHLVENSSRDIPSMLGLTSPGAHQYYLPYVSGADRLLGVASDGERIYACSGLVEYETDRFTRITCWGLEDREPRWYHPLQGAPFGLQFTEVVVDHKYVCVAGYDSVGGNTWVFVLDKFTGASHWSKRINTEVPLAIAVDGMFLYLLGGNGNEVYKFMLHPVTQQFSLKSGTEWRRKYYYTRAIPA